VTVYSLLEQTLHIPWVIQAALLAAALLLSAGVMVRRQLATAGGGVMPDEGVTVRNVFEVIVDGLGNLARDTIGEDWRRYFPVVGTIFFFILIANLKGLIPGLGGATSDINTTVAWAIISFLVYNWVGIRKHGFWYVNQFLGPSFFPLEFVLHLARIVTLAIRLLANMFADHTVVAVWIGLVPIAVPALFMGLGLLVAVLQAFVFSLLTMIYIGLALEEPH
jgi:F-type H+-transporting ATPase subunit a